MGVYLNPGNDAFQREACSEIYIDKTGLIEYTNRVLGTGMMFLHCWYIWDIWLIRKVLRVCLSLMWKLQENLKMPLKGPKDGSGFRKRFGIQRLCWRRL